MLLEQPVCNESFMILRTVGHKTSKQDLSKLMGIGSSKQMVDFIFDTSILRASEPSYENLVREEPEKNRGIR